ncbi:Antigen peptide transporter 2 [Phytophthora boehmeriae]|uniref:Antigen peptide transporter 2 n=1 Tax=Phytophthora boehmeriae TaxID=109152 RepID=A0A8T1X2Y5_9STRA|nr:Antigen peptide transporter 2 [Phytophthora boehmeriae]
MASPPERVDSQSYLEAQTPRPLQQQCTDDEVMNVGGQPDGSITKTKSVSLIELFSFADRTDVLLMSLGTLGAFGAGALRPVLVLLFGDIINDFGPAGARSALSMPTVHTAAINFMIVGVVGFIAAYLQVYCWSVAASRQSKRIRSLYVNAIITKEIGWFDMNDPMQLSSRAVDATVAIQDGMGAKMSDLLHFTSTIVSGIVIAMVKGWELTLIMMIVVPFVTVTGILAKRAIVAASTKSLNSYVQAGAVAQESLTNIRTVHMFNSVEHFVEKYGRALEGATAAGINKAFAVGWGTGVMSLVQFLMYALGFFLGAVFVARDQLDGSTCNGSSCYDAGRIMTVFFSATKGTLAISQAGPSLQAVFSACAAAVDVFELIKRPSLIEPTNDDRGKVLEHVVGDIDIDNVRFAYPTRPEIEVCRGYSLQIQAGETVALVGPSGSGKSTVISLLERFYDPLEGSVKIDGEDVRSLNVKWLRQQISLVGQEPTLFATSIMENIRHGRPSASDSDVIDAAKMANAFHFIMEFPEGFATEVGERGAQLSGGQKQRIAIARAIIKNPPILLLDEATSALDTESERIVQGSLDKLVAESNRTTIIVAHRLSTIRGADRVAVHSGGRIMELGPHEKLVQIPNGHYRLLLDAQSKSMVEQGAGPDNSVVRTEMQSESLSADRERTQLSDPTARAVMADKGVVDADVDTDSSSSEAEDPAHGISLTSIWKMSLPDWKFVILGSLGAAVYGAVYPVNGLLIGVCIKLYSETQLTKHEMLHDMRYYSLYLGILAIACCASIIFMNYGFGVASTRLSTRVRLATYGAMLRQEVGWFDLTDNAPGALISRLTSDSTVLHSMTSEYLSRVLVSVATSAVICGISFYHSWKMTLVMIIIIPLLIGCNFMRIKNMRGQVNAKENNNADALASALLSEAVDSIRTVASFGLEQKLIAQYTSILSLSNAQDKELGISSGIAFGLSQGMLFLSLSLIFYVGGIWVSNGTLDFYDLFIITQVFMTGSFSISMAAQGSVDGTKAKQSAANVFKIINRVPEIDATATSGTVLSSVQGDITFKQVTFAYPSRPNATIYRDYNLTIGSGQTVALVGASGSGKSTAIALLERFYNPTSGMVALDGHDVRSLSLPWLRDRISLVSQEPVLFAGTIAENIALGKHGVSREEIVEAARSANAFDFIANFPQGFDTEVGDRGVQVSGGQKQRIAIARALLRGPDVLLLDEATSALDSESERIVQASLDALMVGKQRTTIVVAHRFSTIRKADVIAVTNGGVIVELGSHAELMRLPGGIYKEQEAPLPTSSNSEPATKRRRTAANATVTGEKPPNRKRFLKFLKSHELKFALEPVARDVATGDVTLVVCRFCQHFGREQRPDKKRRSTKNIKYFRGSFRTDQYQQHHELSHGQTWARYQASSDEEKHAFFPVTSDAMAAASLQQENQNIELNPGEVWARDLTHGERHRSFEIAPLIVELVAVLAIGTTEPTVENAAEKMSHRLMNRAHEPATNGVARWRPPRETFQSYHLVGTVIEPLYRVVVYSRSQIICLAELAATGLSFRQISSAMQSFRAHAPAILCDLVVNHGGDDDEVVATNKTEEQIRSQQFKPQYSEEQTAEYVRLIIAVSLSVTSKLLRECWAFSLELRASMQHAPVRSYLEFRVKVYSGGTLHNLHLLSIPGFESKCKIMMYETLDRMLTAVLPNWRQRLLGVATDGDAQMPPRVLDIIARLQQEAVNPVVYRSTSGCHQLDRIVENFYSSLQGGCFLLLLKELVVYIHRQPQLLAKMSDQLPAMPPCTSGRYVNSREKWIALGQQTNWIATHRELLYQHLEEEKPPSAPDNSWWLFFGAVHWVASQVNATITRMLRKNTTSADQVAAVATLAKDCAIAFHAQGPVGESLLPGDTTPNVKMYTSRKGHFALSKPSMIAFIKEVDPPSIVLIEVTEDPIVDLFAENTAMCGVNMIESLVELSTTLNEQNSPNANNAAGTPRVSDFLPPSLPHELIQLNGRELPTLLQTYGPGVRSFLSDHDIEVMDQELQTLRRGAARETVLNAALAKCNEDMSFEEAWALTEGRFKRLECLAGGFASVFPCAPISTIGGTTDLALCRGEMDTAKVLLADFALEGALHAQQFPALIALNEKLDIDAMNSK